MSITGEAAAARGMQSKGVCAGTAWRQKDGDC